MNTRQDYREHVIEAVARIGDGGYGRWWTVASNHERVVAHSQDSPLFVSASEAIADGLLEAKRFVDASFDTSKGFDAGGRPKD